MEKYYKTNNLITQKLEDAASRSRSPQVKEAISSAISEILSQDAELCEIASERLTESMKLLVRSEDDRKYCGSCGDLLNESGRCPTCDGF